MASGKKNQENSVRLRFAPSPTGYLHVGGARTALFNYLFARSLGGAFLVRIEDTDRKRSTMEATEQVLGSLHWLGVHWDEGPEIEVVEDGCGVKVVGSRGSYGPYLQSQRFSFYDSALKKLLAQGKAYYCFCSDEELEEKKNQCKSMGIPYVYDGKCRHLKPEEVAAAKEKNPNCSVRFFVDKEKYGQDGFVVLQDLVKKEVKFDLNLIGDFIVKKSDGSPTYNFSAVVDDVAMKITHVLRGDDHLSNTARQLVLYRAFEEKVPQFAHIAMILSEEKQKLSKRHGAASVLDFWELGYYPDALINHLALLGWSPSDGVEVIERKKLEKSFGTMKFSSAPAVFHKDKLDYINGLYIRNLSDEDFLRDAKVFLQRFFVPRDVLLAKYLEHEKIDQILLALRFYCKKLGDLPAVLHSFFSPPDDIPQNLKHWLSDEKIHDFLLLAQKHFSLGEKDFIEPQEFGLFVEKSKKELSFLGKKFFMATRVCLMRSESGMELDVYLSLVPRKVVLQRFLEAEKMVLSWKKENQ